MGLTMVDFPFGLGTRGVPFAFPFSGQVFWVNSNGGVDSAGYGRDKDRPFDSINFASAQCVAGRGDIIMVMPGHVETVVVANGLDFGVAGTRVVGLGWGSSKPQISVGTVETASARINANGVWVENLLFTGDVDDIDGVLTINGKTDVILKNIEYRDVTGQCQNFLKASNNSDRLLINGLRYIGAAAAGTERALQLDGCDDLVLVNFNIYGNFSVSAINFVTTLSNRVTINGGADYSYIWTENAADSAILDTITGCTGNIGPNINVMLQDNAANITEAVAGATFQFFQPINLVNLAGESSMFTNITASTDA